jgi:anthranilate phosphoribosyltransferase
MKHVMPVRKELGVRTIFNLLGPLANPLKPSVQLLGVSAFKFITPMAEALAELGVESAFVVHSHDGMDEISPCAITDGVAIKQGKLSECTFNPSDFKFKGKPEDLRGGDSRVNFKLLQDLLNGRDDTISDAVCINTAAVLELNEMTPSMNEGIQLAKDALGSGQVKSYFADLLNRANDLRK